MNKKIQIVVLVGAIAFSVMVLSSPSNPLPLPDPATIDTTNTNDSLASLSSSSISILATNLEKPRAIAVYDDRVFITEQKGKIRIVQNGTLLEQPLAIFRDVNVFDGGLLGIAVHPDFDKNHYLYVFLTYKDKPHNDTTSSTQPNALWNKVIRITESENRIYDAVDIIDGIPASKFTNGGFVKFGPDKKLYIGTGTTSDASHLPQDVNSLAGKILRINDDGSIPTDNPFGHDSPVYSIGHRNPQGITWDNSDTMYVADHGPGKNDEINIIIPGGNYGWPNYECADNDNSAESPILCYDPSIEPGGIIFYDHDRLLGVEQPFIMTSLRASNLYQLDFEQGLASQQSILSGAGRIRDVVVHPSDGTIYLITSNTDGKGFPNLDDDRLIQILR